MTQSIPNGFSMDELQNMLNNAASENTDNNILYGRQELNQDELITATNDFIRESLEICSDPMFHKLILLVLIDRFYQFHDQISDELLEHDEIDAAKLWLKDAGHFQVMNNILINISIGKNDFTYSE